MTEQHSLIPLSPGERLRQAREERGQSLPQVARQLRCSEAVLEAIEADNHTRLAPIYQRGFTRRYAEMMGIAQEEYGPWLETDLSGNQQLKSIFPQGSHARPADRWLKATSYVLASLLVGTLAWQMTHEAVRLSQRNEPAAQTAEPDRPAVKEEADAHVNASMSAMETLRPTGSRTGSAGSRAWAAMDAAARAGEPLAAGEHRLLLNASADSWVEIRDRDGQLLEQDLVRAGSERGYRGFAPFRVTFGRASAIQLSLDGQAVDITPHSRDDVTQMLLDPAAIGETAAAKD